MLVCVLSLLCFMQKRCTHKSAMLNPMPPKALNKHMLMHPTATCKNLCKKPHGWTDTMACESPLQMPSHRHLPLDNPWGQVPPLCNNPAKSTPRSDAKHGWNPQPSSKFWNGSHSVCTCHTMPLHENFSRSMSWEVSEPLPWHGQAPLGLEVFVS